MLFEDIFLWETKDICFLRLWSAIISRIRMNSEKNGSNHLSNQGQRKREKMKKLRWKKLLKNNLRNSTSTSNSFPKKYYTPLPSIFRDGLKTVLGFLVELQEESQFQTFWSNPTFIPQQNFVIWFPKRKVWKIVPFLR